MPTLSSIRRRSRRRPEISIRALADSAPPRDFDHLAIRSAVMQRCLQREQEATSRAARVLGGPPHNSHQLQQAGTHAGRETPTWWLVPERGLPACGCSSRRALPPRHSRRQSATPYRHVALYLPMRPSRRRWSAIVPTMALLMPLHRARQLVLYSGIVGHTVLM